MDYHTLKTTFFHTSSFLDFINVIAKSPVISFKIVSAILKRKSSLLLYISFKRNFNKYITKHKEQFSFFTVLRNILIYKLFHCVSLTKIPFMQNISQILMMYSQTLMSHDLCIKLKTYFLLFRFLLLINFLYIYILIYENL